MAYDLIDDFHSVRAPGSGVSGWTRIASGGVQLQLFEQSVQVNGCSEDGVLGRYKRSPRDKDDDAMGPAMEIKERQPGPVHTILHEMFHFIHYELLAEQRGASLAGLIQFRRIQAIIEASANFKHSRRMALSARSEHEKLLQDSSTLDETVLKSAKLTELYEYLATMDEWLARNYALIVLERHDEESVIYREALQEIRNQDRNLDVPLVLLRDGRDALEKEFTKMFKALGWG